MEETIRYYSSTPLVRKDTSQVNETHGHHILNPDLMSGRIRGTITCLQPIHVGTGQYVPPTQVGIESDVPLVKSFYELDGRLTIPGSSLKGPVRGLVEAFTPSCVCKTRTRLDKYSYAECSYNSQRQEGEICPACKLFGAMGYQGQVSFSDAPLITGESDLRYIPAQYQPSGQQERRHYPHRLIDNRPGNWPLETALPDATFSLHVEFTNLTPAELGVLLIALGQGDPSLCLKIGAGKSAGLGAIRIDNLAAEQWQTAPLYSSLAEEAAVTAVDVTAAVAAALANEELVVSHALTRLQANLACDQVRASGGDG